MISVLKGLVGAALWGVIAEAGMLLVSHLATDASINRTYRMVRVGEVALATTAVAVVLAALPLAIPRVRSAVRDRFGSWLSTWGLALVFWLFLGFHLLPLDPDEIKLTSDPLVQQGGIVLVAGIVALAGPPLLWRWLREREKGVWRAQAATALLLCLGLWLPPFEAGVDPSKPDLFLFSVDTLRADHLGCYGYSHDTSSRLDELCRESVVFENAMAPAPYTIASYASILTGLLQRDHRVYSNYLKAGDELVTIPERLGEAGYRTAAIIDGSFPGTFSNLDQGFELVTQRGVVARSSLPSLSETGRSLIDSLVSIAADALRWDVSVTTDAAERWLREQPSGQPLFAHFYWPFPHAPYAPPAASVEPLPLATPGDLDAERIRAYDGEIRFADAQHAHLFEVLDELGRWDEAWIVFTADHGEELGREVPNEDGGTMRYWGHSRYMFDSSLHVPLIVRPPRARSVEPRRDETVVTTASIAATLLDAAGVTRPDDLVEPLPIESGAPYRQAVVSVSRTQLKPVDVVSVRSGEWRLIETRKPEPGIELYRYRGREESPDLAASEGARVAELLQLLHSVEPPDAQLSPEEAEISITDRERQRLEALGYIE